MYMYILLCDIMCIYIHIHMIIQIIIYIYGKLRKDRHVFFQDVNSMRFPHVSDFPGLQVDIAIWGVIPIMFSIYVSHISPIYPLVN